ncbi:MAG TPA: tetratricopeptide repeat protein [Gallionellaceae bacterium]
MPTISQRTRLIAGGTALTIAAFGLGYLAGRNSHPALSLGEEQPAVTASDMRGAFGNLPIRQQQQAPAPQEQQVASLGSLVSGLEKKVAADPNNTDLQLLLARTYQELGDRDKGIRLLRKLHQKEAGNLDISITLATQLVESSNPQDLQEADRLLEDAVRVKPQVAAMARLYQGDIQLKLGDRAKALQIWKAYVAKLPAGDEQRALYQERIKQATQR